MPLRDCADRLAHEAAARPRRPSQARARSRSPAARGRARRSTARAGSPARRAPPPGPPHSPAPPLPRSSRSRARSRSGTMCRRPSSRARTRSRTTARSTSPRSASTGLHPLQERALAHRRRHAIELHVVGEHGAGVRRVRQHPERVEIGDKPDLAHRPHAGNRLQLVEAVHRLHRDGEPDPGLEPALEAVPSRRLGANRAVVAAPEESGRGGDPPRPRAFAISFAVT